MINDDRTHIELPTKRRRQRVGADLIFEEEKNATAVFEAKKLRQKTGISRHLQQKRTNTWNHKICTNYIYKWHNILRCYLKNFTKLIKFCIVFWKILHRQEFFLGPLIWTVFIVLTLSGIVKEGQIWPNNPYNGQFWGFGVLPEPHRTLFSGSKGIQLAPSDVRNNVQPCSSGVQPK